MKLNFLRFLVVVFIGISIQGCVDTDYSKVKKEYTYIPDLSIPIGYALFQVPDSLSSGEGDLPETLYVTDTIPFNATSIFNPLSAVEKLMYRLYIKNRFAGSVEIQAYYIDANNQRMDAVFDEVISVPAPVTTVDYQIYKASELIVDKYLTDAEIQDLQTVKKVLVEVTLFDLNEEKIQWFDTYEIKVNLGVEVKMQTSLF